MPYGKGLGRRVPTDWEHVERYPLTAARLEEITTPRPIVIGVNWYSNFDEPVKDSAGHYWIGKGDLGRVRGGHCVCLKPKGVTDNTTWWDFYDQGAEGACVGFGSSRMMSLLNRERYFARWLWDKAKMTDEWSDTNPGDDNGTSVRAALSVLKDQGHVTWKSAYEPLNVDWRSRDNLTADASKGISAYRWVTSMDDALQVLGYQGLDYVDVINSWGRSYPHLTRMPVTTLERLWKEDGEVGVPTDR
jgi:hypothetical protein